MFQLNTVGRLLLLTLLGLAWSRPAVAQDQRAVLEVVINDVSAGEAVVTLRGDDVLVSASTLTDAGLRLGGERLELGSQEVVSLKSLAPAVRFRVDERELRLHITAQPELLGDRIYDLFSGPPRGLVYRSDSSGFLNYALNYATGGHLDGFAESALSVRNALVYNTVSVARGQQPQRGLTSVTLDERSSMRRWTVGDSLAYSGPLGGDAWIAGISVSKEFSINPYFVRHPTLSIATPISVPSVMEVQVNGQVVSREPVAPGRLEVRNLPMTLGRNDAQVIVRDAFGLERELSSTYYLTTTALAQGVHEYQYSVGFRRAAIGVESWDYRTPVALARHRVGLSDSLTAGGRVEVHPGRLLSAGPALNVRLPFGELESAVSVSRRRGEWGGASLVGFSVTSRPVSAGGSVQVASRRYATLTPRVENEDPATQATVFASASLGGPVSVTAQHSLTKLHQGLTRSRSGLLSSVRLSRYLDLTASVTRVRDEGRSSYEAYAGVTIVLGGGSASASHVRDGRGNRMAVDAQRSLPLGEGFGYQLHAETGDAALTSGVARYQGRYGRYELRQETVAGQAYTTATVAGSIVGIGGGLHASRPIQDSFALIRVPGVRGVRAFASHQEVGRTGRNGDLLVPDLQSYYGNLLDVADGDIPLQYSVPGVEKTLALPYRGGAVALFDVQKIQRVVGTIAVARDGDREVPAYGEIVVTTRGREIASPVGTSGRFYFEDISAGKHTAVVRDGSGRECTFTITVPQSDETVVDLGPLQCEARRP